jgi:hypothetical protein
MKCVRCSAEIDLAAEICATCGTPIDTDGDGMPDAVAKLVEDKVREALEARDRAAAKATAEANERAREARERDERVQRQEYARREVESLRGNLASVEAELESLETSRGPLYHVNGWLSTVLLACAVLVGGVAFPACIEPMANHSLFGAALFCPQVCDGCRGPGRIFTWHESSAGYEGNVSTQLCHNPQVDVESLTWMEVTNREEGDLKPYRLTLWSSVPPDTALVAVLLFASVPFIAGRAARRSRAMRRVVLVARRDHLARQLRGHQAPQGTGAYR